MLWLDTYPEQHEEGFALAPCEEVHRVEDGVAQRREAAGHNAPTDRKPRVTNAHAQLPPSFLCGTGPQTTGCCHPHSGRGISLNSLRTQINRSDHTKLAGSPRFDTQHWRLGEVEGKSLKKLFKACLPESHVSNDCNQLAWWFLRFAFNNTKELNQTIR